MHQIVIDCDIGNGIAGANVDDGLALALALTNNQIKLEAITTVSGNVLNYKAQASAENFLRQSGYRADVFCGSAQALSEPCQLWRERLDNSVDKLGYRYLWADNNLQVDNKSSTSEDAVDKLYDLICKYPQQINIIAIGPLTNIAKLLCKYQDAAFKIKSIILMGGCFNVKNYLKDTNFGVDPEAASIVLQSTVPVVMAPFDTTIKTMLTKQDLRDIQEIATPLTDYLVKTTRPWLEYSIKTRNIEGCWIHDVLTVAYLIDESLVKTEDHFVNIELTGVFRGKTYISDEGYLKNADGIKPCSSRKIKIITEVDNQSLVKLIKDSLRSC